MPLLKAEIDADPLERGYSAMDDAAVAASLNAVDRPGPVPRLELKDTAVLRGAWARLVRAAPTDDATGNLAVNIMAAFSTDGPPVNLARAEVAAMLTAAVGAGLFTADDRTAFEALSVEHPQSRAAEIGVSGVTPSTIADARRA